MNDQSEVKAGTCPRCGSPVVYARVLGLLTVVNALPCRPEHEWWFVAEGVEVYSIVARRLKLRTAAYRAHAPAATAHPAHTGCGAAVPRPAAVEPPPSKPEAYEPPFEPERCCECLAPLEKGEPYVGYFYSSSQWWAAHLDCGPRNR